MIKRNVVLIADRIKNHTNATLAMDNLEVVSDAYFIPLYNALKKICKKIIHYDNLKTFSQNIALHKEDVILSVWSGTSSRNRRVLVPAICESNNLIYVGADAYLQAISQDKDLSKSLAAKYGINSPNGILIYGEEDLVKLNKLKYPIIVKPNFEGGSIGIFNRNVVDNNKEATELSKELLQNYTPILAEEYIEGEEIYYCISGNLKNITLFEVIRQYINGKTYLQSEIMGAEYKKISDTEQLWDNITESIKDTDKNIILNFYQHLGKADLIRIDGRMNSTGFYLLEISTDVGISTTSTMTQAFESIGFNYEEMLENIINNAILSWEYQNANTK